VTRHAARASSRRAVLSHPVVLAGVGLAVAATAVRVWLLARTWFYVDDLVLINTAAREPLTVDGLMSSYFGHLIPGGRLLSWLVVESGPYNYATATAELAVLYLACGLALLHLLVTLFGVRRAVLLPLVYFLFSPFLVPAMTWWSPGIVHLPALAATSMATAALVRYLRLHRRADLIGSLGWVALGMFFSELAVFAYVALLFITLGYFTSGTLWHRVTEIWTRHRPALVSHAALITGYLGLYVVAAWEPIIKAPVMRWSEFATNASLTAFPAAVVGGPVDWHVAWAAQLETAPPGSVRLLGVVAVAGVLALGVLTRERAGRAWLLPLSQLTLCTISVGKTRALFGPGIALDLRFFTPLALGVALALALAFLPVQDAVESSAPRNAHWLADRMWPATLALGAFVVLSVASAASYPLRHLGDQAPELYFTAVQKTLDSQDGPVDLVDQTIPVWILGAPEANYSRAFAQFDDRVRFPRVVQDDFYVFTAQGQLVRPSLEVVRNARTPAPSGCGYPVRTDRSIPLDGPIIGYGWRVRIGYYARAGTPAVISLGDVDTDVALDPGAHVLELPGDAQYDAVRFSGVAADSGLCVTSITIGTTKPPS
jgi:hypothetical protein